MSVPYTETLDGTPLVRAAPAGRHEAICARLHETVRASVSNFRSTRLLNPRAEVRISSRTVLCPDLSLVTVPAGKLWLAAEIISSDDHRTDTVIKKQLYEEIRLPRLWMVDPRYDNIEVYHASQFGLVLKGILASNEILTEGLLPEFELRIGDLFMPATAGT